MKQPEHPESAESIRARLLALVKSRREDFQLTLGHYAIERLLCRLGRSRYRDRFVLKGEATDRDQSGRIAEVLPDWGQRPR